MLLFLLVNALLNAGITVGVLADTKAGIDDTRFQKENGVTQQNEDWAKTHQIETATFENGIPVPSLTASLGIGRTGPLLLQDHNLQEHLASMAQERIPERVAHAKGAGAFGHFQVTNPEIAKYTRAKLFQPGRKTRVSVRFSAAALEVGSADSVNDIRGFSVKFYTTDGNYDLVMLSIPNFNMRDPFLFPSFNRIRKRNPQTHLQDYDMFWDYHSARPETTAHAFFFFSDFGFVRNYRHMTGFGVNTFKFTGGTDSEPVFIRYHMVSDQGKKFSSPKRYNREAGTDPDYFIRDLYNAIAAKNFPSWTLNIQVMTQKQAKEFKYDPFDPTKILPVKEFPLIPIGKMTLDRNPKDYFNEVEQIAFNPGNFVPGIEPSPDRVLQGRIFAYSPAHRHRLGKNFNQLPINRPRHISKVHTYNRDGFANIYGNGDGGPHYFPNTFSGPEPVEYGRPTVFHQGGGLVNRTETGDDHNHSQINNYFKEEMDFKEQQRTLKAIAEDLSHASPRIQARSLERNWDPVGSEFSKRFRTELVKQNARARLRKAKLHRRTRKNT